MSTPKKSPFQLRVQGTKNESLLGAHFAITPTDLALFLTSGLTQRDFEISEWSSS